MKGKLLGLSSLLFVGLGLVTLESASVRTAFAQAEAGKGAVAGVVTDPTKAVIPGAKVILSNPGIGYHAEATANSEGYFSFKSLTVGEGYRLEVSAPGFSKNVVSSFATSVGTVITENLSLAIGDQGTTIEVQGGNIEQVQTDTSSVSEVIDSQIWNESPLSVRDSNTFVGLTNGAAPDTAGTGRGFSVNGARTGTGDFQLEGFDNNDQGLGGPGIVTISPDAIQEYRVLSSVPPAEYGRAGGFATDTVLKSGTTKWHGSAFEYNRIQALAQNSWFSKTAGLQDHLVRNQFGGSVGGPVYKDRTFFYATAEFQRQRQGSPVTYTAATQDLYNFVNTGQFKQWAEGTAFQNGGATPGYCPLLTGTTCPGTFANAATLGPVFKGEYAQTGTQTFPFGTRNFTNLASDISYEDGDTAPTAANPNGFTAFPVNVYGDGSFIGTQVLNQNRGTLKIDHRLTNKDQLSFTYSADLTNQSYNYGASGTTPGLPEIVEGGGQLFGARWTHTFSPSLLNDFRANYTRHVNNIEAAGPQGTADTESFDSINTGFGKSDGLPQLFTENEFAYEDAVTLTKGKHTGKFGVRFIRTRNGSSFYNDVNGTLYFWDSVALMTDAGASTDYLRAGDAGATTGAYHSGFGTLPAVSGAQDPSTGNAPDPYRGYRANEVSAYAQDDFKVTPRLFINYGLRWDYFGPPHNFLAGIDSNVYFGMHNTILTSNPFAPGGNLYLGEQSSGQADSLALTGGGFRCVGHLGCGNPAATTPAGYAPPSNTNTIWNRDINNFAPRLGFSFDAFGNGKLVMRGGFGIGYDRLYNNVYENIRFNAPHFVDSVEGVGEGSAAVPESQTATFVQNPFIGNSALPTAGAVPRHVNQNLKTAYYENIHMGVETNILHGYVIEANYIGTLGRQLVGLMNINTFEGRVACTETTAGAAACTRLGLTTAQKSSARPNATFSNDNFRTNGFSSSYNAAQLSVRRGYAHGFQILANYSYGHALDQTSDVFTIKGGGTGIPTPYNPSHNYGNADYDVRHLASFTVNYRTQSEHHKLLFAGWGVSPIFTMRSGSPIYTKDSATTYDPNKSGLTGVQRVVYSGPGSPQSSLNHNVSPYGTPGVQGTGAINPTYWKPYVCPANVNGGLFCDPFGDRNQLNGLRQYNLDAAVSKHLQLTERFALTLQAAFFDIDGHVEWSDPSGDIGSTNFGKSTSAGGREGQLSGRIEF